MHPVDLAIFAAYILLMLGIGFFFYRKNKGAEDFFVGGRDIGSLHIGLSVVATDVGGGFSIGLGGLGFLVGMSGSWMLFTGLIGAYFSAIFLIPKVRRLSEMKAYTTFPEILGHFFGPRVALIAGIISAIGYLGFTSSQILAGAKLASATFPDISLQGAVWAMGGLIVVYTVLGGLKAVIFTDTIQWIILILGLALVGLPVSYFAVGGLEGIQKTLPASFFEFSNLRWQDFVNWLITIVPIWFVGMTLYQRIYAARSDKEARRAWMIAGIFEWPIMALLGVSLGLLARVAADQGAFAWLGVADPALMDEEMGIPFLLRTVLPTGLMGIMLAAYFSAIMSTADSCLMASSGNLVTDLLGKWFKIPPNFRVELRISQISTLVLGLISLVLASMLDNVLEAMLYSYGFMVSGLFIPVLGALFWKRRNGWAALLAMILGGGTTLALILGQISLPWGLNANLFGLLTSLSVYLILTLILPAENYSEPPLN
ncbi:MAG: sodium:solute symporter family protein [Bacteroidia bacterium]|nr:sodium:solute symporter family protein [Bacteroidia bacterium]